MSQAVASPDFFKNSKPDAAFATLDPTESLAEGIGSSYGVIGYKGKVLSLRLRGEVHIFTRPDDGTPIGYLDVVILRSAAVKAKSYYRDGFDENASAGKRPVCASIDGITPDADVLEKQADACALCPRNEWRTDANGRKGRDCSDYKRLSVLILPHQTQRLMGAPLLEPVFLRIPPASLNDLAVFGETMSGQGWPFSSFVTRISFDPALSHPKFVFRAIQPLTGAEAKVILDMREDTQSKRITGEDQIATRVAMIEKGKAAVSAMGPAQSIGIAPAQQPVQAQPALPAQQPAAAPKPTPPANAPAAPVSTGLVEALANPSAAAAPPPPTQTVVPPQPQTIDATPAGGAFGNAFSPPPADPAPQSNPGSTVGQSADDIGEVIDDPSLDDKIAALMAS